MTAQSIDVTTRAEAASALASGKAVAFPTDTVVGIGVAVEAARTPDALYEIKQREPGKPIAWLVGGVSDLAHYGDNVPELAFELARRHWPGALTIIVPAAQTVPAAFRGADGSIGLRMPAAPAALELIESAGCPLATSSANMAGEDAPASINQLDPRIVDRVACVYAGEGDSAELAPAPAAPAAPADAPAPAVSSLPLDTDSQGAMRQPSGEASTVVSFMDGTPRVVREGAVTMDDIIAAQAAIDQAAQAAFDQAASALADSVIREEFSFPSADGVSTIHARWWLPAAPADPATPAQPRAIVQLVHGMSEHIGRYDAFAAFLASKGFAVCGHDHIGHGRSVSSPKDFGCLPAKEGKDIMVADAHRVRQLAAERFPGLKHLLFGHSMGSFVVRSYVSKHGEGLAGAIVCGTGNQALALSKAGNFLANLLCTLRGPRTLSPLIHSMSIGAYAKAIPNARTPHDWLSHDPAVADAFAADPTCGFPFSVSGYAALTSLTGEVVTPACAAGVPKDLPLLYIAGEGDPVGDCGKGVRAAVELVRDAGVRDVSLILYPDMRHEILNEFGKAQVYADVLEWMEGRLS